MKGSVTLVAMLSRAGELQVNVEDTGIGIPSDKLQTIFTMFGKLDSGQLNPQGCGLGLSISSMLVGKLGGEQIRVISTPHCGSVFSFKIPVSASFLEPFVGSLIAEVDEDILDIPNERIRLVSSAQDILVQSSVNAQVLIVDDSPFNRLVLRKILTTVGYSYAEASTGLEAVSMVKAACDRGSSFSIVLMDIEMPEMDGISATRELGRLLAQGVLSALPVIIGCSAYCTEEDRATAKASGMVDYIEKPISRQRLFELLRLHYH